MFHQLGITWNTGKGRFSMHFPCPSNLEVYCDIAEHASNSFSSFASKATFAVSSPQVLLCTAATALVADAGCNSPTSVPNPTLISVAMPAQFKRASHILMSAAADAIEATQDIPSASFSAPISTPAITCPHTCAACLSATNSAIGGVDNWCHLVNPITSGGTGMSCHHKTQTTAIAALAASSVIPGAVGVVL
ncbi:hypothetical protein J132_07356 [Termitomyces sp. J132]|nr:hypothetical protein J132_07356 [Termitomyces sp. J132]